TIAVCTLIGVRHGILVQGIDHIRIHARPPRTYTVGRTIRIHARNFRRSQRSESRWDIHAEGLRIELRIHSLNLLCATGTLSRVRALVHENAFAKRLAGDLAELLRILSSTLAFIGEKKEQTILLDRT